jgi:DNA-binding MarR family transcriptional regulator
MRARLPRKLRKHHASGELRAVVDETIALFSRLRWVSEHIYGEEGRSAAKRGVLRGLVRFGPQTVPKLARTRSVTRQHTQLVVDRLVADGLVELVTNPQHARSRLARVTPRGEALVRRMDELDTRVLRVVGSGLPRRDLDNAARTLRSVRRAFELRARQIAEAVRGD